MNHSIEAAVVHAIAAHAEITINRVHPHQHLERDLHLQPLNLVVIVLKLEDEEQLAFPVERLADVRTVRDLANAARQFASANPRIISGQPFRTSHFGRARAVSDG